MTAWHGDPDRLDERGVPCDCIRDHGRGGRVVEGARLERVYTGNRIEGSNPSLSATCLSESVLPIRLRPDFSVVFGGYAGGAEHWPRRQEVRMRSLWADILWTS